MQKKKKERESKKNAHLVVSVSTILYLFLGRQDKKRVGRGTIYQVHTYYTHT